MEKETRLDEVTVFEGKLSFLIPHDWEEMDTEHGDFHLYSRPQTDSGWLRVSLNTATAVGGTPAENLLRIFGNPENVFWDEQSGNLVNAYERDSQEQGVKIHLYYWIVANVIKPKLVRVAVFSYTILAERINDEETANTVSLLRRILSRANLCPGIQERESG